LNKLEKAIAAFQKNNGAITKKVSDALIASITPSDTPAQIGRKVDAAFAKYKYKKAVTDLLVNDIVGAVSIGVTEGVSVKSVKAWYLDKAYSAAGVPIKTTLKGAVDVSAVKEEIRRSLKLSQSWRKAAQDLSDKKILVSDVAKDVQIIIDKARGVYGVTNDAEAYQDYKKAVSTVQRRINSLTDQDTSKLKRAYQDILDITNKSSVAQVDNAIKYASYYKQRYNAERIARTEMARAYGDASFSDAIYNELVVGVEFSLSSSHDIYDICNVHCGVDLYGMGEGVYPKDHAPEYPFHPNCMCIINPVVEGDAPTNDKRDYNPKKAQSFIDNMSDKEKRISFGAKNADESTKSISKQLKSMHEDKKPTIPESVLYGKK